MLEIFLYVLIWWASSCCLTLGVFISLGEKRKLRSPSMIIAWLLVSPFWPLVAVWAIARVR